MKILQFSLNLHEFDSSAIACLENKDDFYNVLTTNWGDANTNDVGLESGNHHRWWNGAVQHETDGDDDANSNVLEYPTGDNHPSRAGNQKATTEFVPLLNNVYSGFQVIPEFSELAVLAVLMILMLAIAVLSKNRIVAA